MATFFKTFLPMLVLVIVTLIIYNVLKIYVLDKLKVNKWIPLIAGLVVLFAPAVIWPNIRNTYWYYVQTTIFLMLFLWFMDLIGFTKRRDVQPKDKNSTVIRTKANPNRVNKNKDMDVIKQSNKKSKKKKKNKK